MDHLHQPDACESQSIEIKDLCWHWNDRSCVCVEIISKMCFFPAGKRTLSKSEPLELHADQHSKCSLKNHTWTSMYFLILNSESVINQVLKQFFGCFELLNQFLGVVLKLKDATYVKSKQKISVIIKKNLLCNVTRLIVFQHCLKAPREQRHCFKIYPL